MAKKKIDGVIEAARFTRNGQIDFVRAYERRGFSYSDSVLLDRKALLERLKAKKSFITGQRKQYRGSTFVSDHEVNLVIRDGHEFISTRAETAGDTLEGVPLI